ncbi:MAG: hypothetical protein U9R08_04905 [Nanoarchaeota archaeon]|nr:hypothetical protein [Nanoarchaeota archaeon]
MDIFNIYYKTNFADDSNTEMRYFVEGGDHHEFKLLKYKGKDYHSNFKCIAVTVAANYTGAFNDLTLLFERPQRMHNRGKFGIIKGELVASFDVSAQKMLAREIKIELEGRS